MTMSEEIRLFSARRSYEYAVDGLRMSALSTPHAMHAIQAFFNFQQFGAQIPPATFGAPLPTTTSGLVFQNGTALVDDQVVPIRALYVEIARIVIEISSGSGMLDPIFSMLRAVVENIPFAIDSPVIPEPIGVRDWSAMLAKFPAPLDRVFIPEIRELLKDGFGSDLEPGVIAAPLILVHSVPSDEGYVGAVSPGLELAVRAGSNPSDMIYVSAAFLDSSAHEQYVKRLAAALAASPASAD